jgi:hypothetical protein
VGDVARLLAGAPQPGRPTDRERSATIRQWAKERGYTVYDRGRIPASVMEAYEKEAS